jgi:hypothetical protein
MEPKACCFCSSDVRRRSALWAGTQGAKAQKAGVDLLDLVQHRGPRG